MIKQILTTAYDNNFSYFLSDGKSKNIAIVDPGDVPLLETEMSMDGLHPTMILITHSHHDHVGGVSELVEKYGIPLYIHENAMGCFDVEDVQTIHLKDGDIVRFGDMRIEVMHTPGHIDDAVCYYIPAHESDDKVGRLFTGDTLFVEGVGRADLERSNAEDLYKSLQRIKKLPGSVEIYSGHDYGSRRVSSIEWEKKHNPYMKCGSLEEFMKLRMGTYSPGFRGVKEKKEN